MTKFILHGGATSRESVHNNNFYLEILKDLGEPIEILLVYFARKKDLWKMLLEDDEEKFKKAAVGREINLVQASDDISTLEKQIKSAQAIYMRGGRENGLMTIMGKINNLTDLFEGKTVAGSSAGANFLSKYHYRNSTTKVEEGAGILPIKVFTHYKGQDYETDWEAADKQLKEYGEDLEIHHIPETEFVIINK